jgi:hypothetical protein
VLLRIVAEYRRGMDVLSPGTLVDLDASDAARLIEDGLAVPAVAEIARETR